MTTNSSRHMVRLIVSIILIQLLNCSLWAGFSGQGIPTTKHHQEKVAREGFLLAKLKSPGVNRNQIAAVLQANNVSSERSFDAVPGLQLLRMTDSGNAKSKAARMQGLQRRMNALMATGLFEYVEPDWEVQIMQTPTDSAFVDGTLWGLLNSGQNGGTTGIDVNAVGAWAITTGSPSVVVGVIDTGIRYTHQDLSSSMWTNPGEIPGNGLDDDGNGWIDDVYGLNAIAYNGDPMDDNNHGSHVAGTIAASAFDAGSHVGVAYDVKLMALKALSWAGTGGISGVLACIDYAIENGVDILNNSWGGTGFSQSLMDAIDSANSAGILFIAAAGNSASNNDIIPFYPAGYELPNVISVAAIDRNGALASFSNYGHNTVDLAAPGVAIYSTTADTDTSYSVYNGTSMATPHVTGVAALVASAHPSAGITELTGRLLQSTATLPGLVGYTQTKGMVDAETAILISDDGEFEIQVNTNSGALVVNEWNPVFIRVTDLVPVTSATVTVAVSGESPTACLDDGAGSDLLAGDAIYTGDVFISPGSTTIDLDVTVEAPGKTPFAQTYTFQVLNPPPNDNFADRFILLNSESTTTGTSKDSTLEPDEPINPYYSGKHTVWWEWTPDVSGSLAVTTQGTSWDTTLAVYTGTSLNNLSLVGYDDDGVGFASVVHFTAVAGQTYLIQVNGYANASGPLTLRYGDLDVGVPNDYFRNRIVLESGTTQTIGSNVGSTTETGEPMPLFELPGLDTVWYEWIAPSDNPATITTFGSDFDTIMAIWQGTEITSLIEVTSNDDANGTSQSSVTFTPIAGESYMIQIYGYLFDPVGKIVLNYPDPAPPVVPNDFFSQRILLSHESTQTTGTNVGATFQNKEPRFPGTAGDASVWWEWIAPLSGNVSINTTGSTFDTTLAVYTGTSINELVLVAANDDAGGPISEVTFFTNQGESYMIQVNGSGTEQGEIKLNYPKPAPPAPVNDNFDQRIVLQVGTNEASGTNLGATLEIDEPLDPLGSGTHSVWWEWYAPSTDPATMTTAGSDFDTTIAVYEGRDFSEMVLVAADNDSLGQQSSVTFNPVQGRGYKIRVSGFGEDNGAITMTYPEPDLPRPENDNFVDRTLLEPGTIQAIGYNEFATLEINEPKFLNQAAGSTLWWEWIAPTSGMVTIDTFGSTMDTILAIYTGNNLGALTLIGGNDDAIGYTSAVTFDAIAGSSYKIQVDNWPGLEGLIYLNYPMPYPVAATPGRFRLSGSVGQTVYAELSLANGDNKKVNFTVYSDSGLIQGDPASGSIMGGSSAAITLQIGPLPAFEYALMDTVKVDLTHNDIPLMELPVEIIDQSIVIDIPDPNLRLVIEQNLGRMPGEPIADIEMGVLTSLDAIDRGIVDLTGLEYAINLFYLHLDNNQISDITPLGSIPYLFILGLANNNIADISPLLNSQLLMDLDVRWNYLDITPGSDDMAVIETLRNQLASVLYDPQKDTMLSYTNWISQFGLEGISAQHGSINNHLGVENVLAYGMGLDPLSLTSGQLPVAMYDADTNTYKFTYYRNLYAIGVTTSILNSYDLGSWELAAPVQINILWDDGNGHQMVEAVFEDASSKLFFTLDVSPIE